MGRAFATGVVAGYGIAIPVGAIAVLIIETGIRSGFRPALFAGSGAATADFIYAVLALIGGSTVLATITTVEEPLRVASGVVLILIAVVGIWRARSPVEMSELAAASTRDLFGTYLRFLGLTLVNPATVIYFVAVVVGLGVTASMTVAEGLLFATGAGLASLSWQTSLAALSGLASGRLTDRSRVALSVVGYLMVLGFGVVVLVGQAS
jgi:threonine/homoserine/homoserine lactone efflux protein